jgi:hypothetical protein
VSPANQRRVAVSLLVGQGVERVDDEYEIRATAFSTNSFNACDAGPPRNPADVILVQNTATAAPLRGRPDLLVGVDDWLHDVAERYGRRLTNRTLSICLGTPLLKNSKSRLRSRTTRPTPSAAIDPADKSRRRSDRRAGLRSGRDKRQTTKARSIGLFNSSAER